MKNRITLVSLCLLLLFTSAQLADACDLCAVYSMVESERGTKDTFNLGIANQFTHYESNIKPDGQNWLPGQHLESNISQFYFHYNLSDQFSVQLNLPIIYRDFRRIKDSVVETGNESGSGDLAVLAKFEPFRMHRSNSAFIWEVFGGLKLPTGDSDRLREEQEEVEEESALRHGSRESGSLVGGEDLALGSGSYDWILGTSFFGEYDRFFLTGNAQYALRQEGDFDYEFGDDFQWHVGPGYLLSLNDESSLGLRLRLSGELKQKDKNAGREVEGTRSTRFFVGPELRYTISDLWFLSASFDFALQTESAADGVIPRYRSLLVISRKFRT